MRIEIVFKSILDSLNSKSISNMKYLLIYNLNILLLTEEIMALNSFNSTLKIKVKLI